MEKLFQYQNNLLSSIDGGFFRYLFSRIPWKERFVGIKGLRGVGKTTLLLQYLKYQLGPSEKNLYVTLDHPYFYTHSLYELAESFYHAGGETLLVDEVHKMSNWSGQIKTIYDGLPEVQVVFTASSALDLYRGEADLSRRVLTFSLAGMSFREYLHLYHGLQFEPVELPDLLANHLSLAGQVTSRCRPLALFRDYLISGYFPFSRGLTAASFESRLIQTLEVVLNEDISYVEGYTADNIFKLKKLLGILAESAPFTANISSIAGKLGIGRNTLMAYLHALEKAGLLRFLNREGKGISLLQKPDKIYLENTNLAHALKMHPEKGTLRETFMLNQLTHAGLAVYLPQDGDIRVDDGGHLYVFEIGGKAKTDAQIKNIKNSFIVADDIEIGFRHKIPLYLFGFLY
jgi:predicted AAA+ superfamily ATPase